jgi:hypothetical protein
MGRTIMRLPNKLDFHGPLLTVRHSVWVFGALSSVAAIWLAAGALQRYSAARRDESAARMEIASAAGLSQKAAGLSAVPDSEAEELGDASAIQSFIENEAEQRGCSISEFRAASTSRPYTFQSSSGSPSGPWTQTDVAFSVQGRLPDV